MTEVTRRDAMRLVAAGAAVTIGAKIAQAEEPKAAFGQDWDCVVNKTGKTLLVTLASGNAGGPGYILANDQHLSFKVGPTTKKMAYVAFEYGSNNLVSMQEFGVLHQQYPPTACLHIVDTTPPKRVKEENVEKSKAPATPSPY